VRRSEVGAVALIRAGLSIKAIQRLLGHKSAVETLDTYGHLMGDEDDRSRTAIRRNSEKLRTTCGLPEARRAKRPGQTPGCGWAGS
jgi:hypothetical protein